MADQLRVGVVGCGYWGPNLIRNFYNLAGCELVAVCDRDAARLLHITTRFPGTQGFTDLDEMLAEAPLDAVAVATPVHLHHAMARKCLDAGKHVFIEKPMARTSAECQDLIDVARKGGLTLMVGHTFLYSTPVRMIKEVADSGEIGEIRYISSRRLNLGLFQKDINVVWDLAPHDISIIVYLIGEEPSVLNCQGKANVTPGIEDVANLTLYFPSGGWATVHDSWLDPLKVRAMTIVGTDGMIVYDDVESLQKLRIYDQRVERPPHYDTFAEFQYSYHYGDMRAPRLDQSEPLKIECEHFLECIGSGATPLTDGISGRNLVRVLEAASESLKQDGARVAIETD